MDTPDYMNKIESVSRSISDQTSLRAVGLELLKKWGDFEEFISRYNYNVLSGYYGISTRMEELCGLLYRVPEAEWELDCKQLVFKNKEYGGSWHQRGGTGAFFMLARKMDRVVVAMARSGNDLGHLIASDKRQEGVLDDLGDLRRYLILCLAWLSAENEPEAPVSQVEVEPF
jgi:hypothetical protein